MRQVAVTGLYKAFGSHPVLTGVDLEVPAGSLTASPNPTLASTVRCGNSLPSWGT